MEEIYKQLRNFVANADVVVITAKAPARWAPDKTGGVRIVDYLDILKK